MEYRTGLVREAPLLSIFTAGPREERALFIICHFQIIFFLANTIICTFESNFFFVEWS